MENLDPKQLRIRRRRIVVACNIMMFFMILHVDLVIVTIVQWMLKRYFFVTSALTNFYT